MGMMKAFLMEKITEFALKKGIDEDAIYKDPILYKRATAYASRKLMLLKPEHQNKKEA